MVASSSRTPECHAGQNLREREAEGRREEGGREGNRTNFSARYIYSRSWESGSARFNQVHPHSC